MESEERAIRQFTIFLKSHISKTKTQRRKSGRSEVDNELTDQRISELDFVYEEWKRILDEERIEVKI